MLAAVLWAAGLLYALVEDELAIPQVRPPFQAYLVLVGAIYFTSQWVLGGQTLAMKTWRLRSHRLSWNHIIPTASARKMSVGVTALVMAGQS